MEAKKRFDEYDLLRIIGTLFVVIGHSAYLNIQTGVGGVAYSLPADVASIYANNFFEFERFLSGWVYGFHMPMFFMLSGLCFAIASKTSFDQLCIKKVRRLIIPFFVAGLFFMFPVKFLGNFYNRQSVFTAIGSFYSGGESGHLWFLPALFWCILVFWGITGVTGKSIFLTLFVSLFANVFIAKFPFDFLLFKTGCGYIKWFGTGYFIHKLFQQHDFKLNSLKIVGGGALVLGILSVLEWKLSHNGQFRILVNSLWILFIGIFATRQFPGLMKSKLMRVLLRNSFYIYLFHDPLEYIVLRFAFHFNWLSYNSGYVTYVFLRTAGVVIASIVLGEFIEKFKRTLKDANTKTKGCAAV